MTVLSAVLVFGSIAAFATVYASGTHQRPVLVVTRTIEQGQPIRASDLGQASASISSGVAPIPVSDAPELGGRRAAVTIPAGTLLTLGDTTTSQPIASGEAVVGIALKPGQFPSAGLEAGDQVMIVETGALGSPLGGSPTPAAGTSSSASASGSGSGSGSQGQGTGVLVARALVFDVQPSTGGSDSSDGGSASAGDSQLVSVEVSGNDAPAVSSAAAAGQVSLVLLPRSAGSGGAGGSGSS